MSISEQGSTPSLPGDAGPDRGSTGPVPIPASLAVPPPAGPGYPRAQARRSGADAPLHQPSVQPPCDRDGGAQALRRRIRSEVKALLDQRTELAHMEKLAAVREKTMRVAHDIRNPLAVIQAVCGSLILETEDSEQRERLQLIGSQVDSLAAALADAVHETADPHETQAPPSAPVSLEPLIHSLTNLIQYQTGDGVTFRCNIEAGLRCTLPERGLTRSLYQLLRNAAAAAEGPAGRETDSAPDAESGPEDALEPPAEAVGEVGEVVVECRREGAELVLEVLDNGPGLPPELLELGLRAYAAGPAGPALGLASVERFVLGLGGRLELGRRASEGDPRGARVAMRLPVDCEGAA